MKKLFLTVGLFLFMAGSIFAEITPALSYFEALGSCSFVQAGDAVIINTENPESEISPMFSLEFNLVLMGNINSGLYSIYLKKGEIRADNTNTGVYSESDGYDVSVIEKWNVHYIGAGIRKYFFIDERKTRTLMPYAGIDIGCNFIVSDESKSEITIWDSGGNYVAGGKITGVEGGAFGINAETGVDFWPAEAIGVALKAGYRLCSMNMSSLRINDGSDTDLIDAGITDKINFHPNFSSFYIQAGVTFRFQDYRL